MAFVETFLNSDTKNEECKVLGYKIYRKDRQNKEGGGLLVYVRQSMSVKERPELSSSSSESLWLEVSLPKSKSFLISIVYRPPDSLQSWIDHFEIELENASPKIKNYAFG